MNETSNYPQNAHPLKEHISFHKMIKKEGITLNTINLFQKIIYNHYINHARQFPWRETSNPYHILVSEFMLQQTQTQRVIKKYEHFISIFPDFPSLAAAPLKNVLEAWHGLGYNRRALNLKNTAEIVIAQYNGVFPSHPDVLMTFPGIGRATACAIAAFAFSTPVVFVETNIRTVFIYFFFTKKRTVKDKEILSLVEKTLDRTNPRHWYYALMDYGVILKKRFKTLTKKSAHYRKQPPFKGSNRRIRGKILNVLIKSPETESHLIEIIDAPAERIKRNLLKLEEEQFIKRKGNFIFIA